MAVQHGDRLPLPWAATCSRARGICPKARALRVPQARRWPSPLAEPAPPSSAVVARLASVWERSRESCPQRALLSHPLGLQVLAEDGGRSCQGRAIPRETQEVTGLDEGASRAPAGREDRRPTLASGAVPRCRAGGEPWGCSSCAQAGASGPPSPARWLLGSRMGFSLIPSGQCPHAAGDLPLQTRGPRLERWPGGLVMPLGAVEPSTARLEAKPLPRHTGQAPGPSWLGPLAGQLPQASRATCRMRCLWPGATPIRCRSSSGHVLAGAFPARARTGPAMAFSTSWWQTGAPHPRSARTRSPGHCAASQKETPRRAACGT